MNIISNVKTMIYKTVVETVMLYGAETWMMEYNRIGEGR